VFPVAIAAVQAEWPSEDLFAMPLKFGMTAESRHWKYGCWGEEGEGKRARRETALTETTRSGRSCRVGQLSADRTDFYFGSRFICLLTSQLAPFTISRIDGAARVKNPNNDGYPRMKKNGEINAARSRALALSSVHRARFRRATHKSN